MFVEILVAILLGVLLGCITGLLPGIHINLISALAITFPFPVLPLSFFIISMSITHTFLDAIPAIYLGAPDSSHALSILPGHRFLFQGKGHLAVRATLVGSLYSLGLSAILFPLILFIMNFIAPTITRNLGPILLIITILFLLTSKNKLYSISIFLLAGTLGMISMNLPLKQPLFHSLTGLFGLSVLLMTKDSKIPKQIVTDEKFKGVFKSIFAATGIGTLAGFLPGLGTSQAALFASKFVKGDISFLIVTGGLNTVNMLVSLGTFFLFGKARNGSIVAIKSITHEITRTHLIAYIGCALLVGAFAFVIGNFLSKKASVLITKLPYRKISFAIVFLLISISFFFDGFLGLTVLITSTLLGLSAKTKHNLMGVIMVPVIILVW